MLARDGYADDGGKFPFAACYGRASSEHARWQRRRRRRRRRCLAGLITPLATGRQLMNHHPFNHLPGSSTRPYAQERFKWPNQKSRLLANVTIESRRFSGLDDDVSVTLKQVQRTCVAPLVRWPTLGEREREMERELKPVSDVCQ